MTVEVLHGDCVELMRRMPDDSVDAVVTDPPYGLSREPDAQELLQHWLAGDDYRHRGGGFMGKTWDSFVPGPSVWRELSRVLKPGGHIVVFGGTRTYDLMVLAIRLAGFEIRDSIHWTYASGFPKSLDVSKAIDKAVDAEGHWTERFGETARVSGDGSIFGQGVKKSSVSYVPETDNAKRWAGWGTALKPAHEPIVVARKPLAGTVAANVLEWGTGGLNIDGCRVGTDGGTARDGKGNAPNGSGWENMKGHAVREVGAGRWPANVVFDSVAGEALDKQSGVSKSVRSNGRNGSNAQGVTGMVAPRSEDLERGHNDSGGASRFFTCADWSGDDWPFVYVPKPSKKERNAGLDGLEEVTAGQATGGRKEGSDGLNSPRAGAGRTGGAKNHHPTVKPVALMRHLVRLVTPPNGTVLDPFAGSGTTLVAAVLEGFNAVGCEMTDEYLPIIQGRVAWAQQEAQRRTTEQQPNLFEHEEETA